MRSDSHYIVYVYVTELKYREVLSLIEVETLCVIAGYIVSCFNSQVSFVPCVIRNMCLSTGLCSQERVSCVFFGKMLQVPLFWSFPLGLSVSTVHLAEISYNFLLDNFVE